MSCVGIIANPASGKDIRRLVAHGSVFDNDEKVSIVRRVLLGLEALGVDRVLIMPDRFGIGQKALRALRDLRLKVDFLEMRCRYTQEDSRQAAEQMVARGAGCLVVLGGDGTNRIVAKASGEVPLMPISTGTNNVFPVMIEGTIAGMAAALVARGEADSALRRAPRLEILPASDERIADITLVDAAVYAERFLAARAVWDPAKIRQLVLTRAEPGNIGLSSIGAHLLGGNHPPDHALYLEVAAGGREVLAPVAPGLIRPVPVSYYRLLAPGEELYLTPAEPCVLALDGEREMELSAGTTTRVRLNLAGPWVVDSRRAIEIAALAHQFEG